MADVRWGEVCCAYVIAVSGQEITPQQVISHCETRLARFKVPKSVVIGEAIPRAASGKAQKHVLRDRASAG